VNVLDLLGKRFGRLVVMSPVPLEASETFRNQRWQCQCDCGAVKSVRGYSLTASDGARSCGCLMRERVARSNRERPSHGADLIGMRFGRLIVVSRARNHESPAGHLTLCWECHCDCGQRSEVATHDLRSRHTRSCGCFSAEQLAGANRTHGMTRTPTYRSWQAMITRCTNPRRAAWKNYGGRGISVCARWRLFENFLTDMGERPAGTSIERINNDGNYEPSNCKWGTRKEQSRNSRQARLTQGHVDEIRRRADMGTSIEILASTFRVSETHVEKIVAGECWKPELHCDCDS
jgi:hypothetical protein